MALSGEYMHVSNKKALADTLFSVLIFAPYLISIKKKEDVVGPKYALL